MLTFFSFSFFQTGLNVLFFSPFKLPSKLPWTQYLKTLNAKSWMLPHHFFFSNRHERRFFVFVFFLFPHFKLLSTLHISKPWMQYFKTLNAKPWTLPFFLFFKPAWTFDIFNFFSFKLNWKGFGLGLIMELNK